ncbi:MAG: response regulator [Rhodospirillales bacterium]
MAKKLRFYIVDDDPDSIEIMTELLKAEGHSVDSNTDSAKAISEIAELKPDCVLTDIMMPGIDGLELCKRLRKDPGLEATKILVISGKSYEFDKNRSFEFGADGFIVKPLNVQTFADRVYRVTEDRMDVAFWGVRGTLPVPGEGSVRYGGNTSCVTIEFPRDQLFIFDAGSGIKKLSDHLLAQKRRRFHASIFISHPHWDHINALPFFGPLYMQGNVFDIYGSSHGDLSTQQLISAQMDGVYFPITIHEFASSVSFHDLKEETVEIDGIEVSTMLLSHPGYCLGYRVEYGGRAVCYVTDNELFNADSDFFDPSYVKKLTRFVEGAEVLITDCTYTDEEYASKEGWGHSPIGRVVELAHEAKVKTLYLFHHDPDQSDDDIDAKLETARKLLEEKGSDTKVIAPGEGYMVKV